MILFDLQCGKGHGFEGWFRDNAAYEAQEKAREVACPACGDTAVRKAIMAPRIGKGRNASPDAAPNDSPAPQTGEPPQPLAKLAADPRSKELRAKLVELRKAVEANCDYVGPRFAEEARRIHYGEREHRNIYGEASKEEAKALSEEGVEFGSVPWIPRTDA
jgi:hypothetical protein